ncbi:hypothetical protein [Alienimonas sp. DA493]|uniref:hypothetical protein n=1 Tax=Alienimonas sp. DA493 TaxID=3373605 RepID=UPI0037552351
MNVEPPPSVAFQIGDRTIAKVVYGTAAGLWALGVATRLWVLHGGLEGWIYYTPNRYFGLDRENGLPAWFATVLLLACGAAAAVAGGLDRSAAERDAAAADNPAGRREGRFWWVIAIAFAYLSVDEMTSIHESFGESVARRVMGEFGERVFFTWVLLGIPAAGLFAAASIPFLLRLPRAIAIRFLTAGALFVGGAAGIEIVASRIIESGGPEAMLRLPYSLTVFVEEGLEMAGAALFLVSILKHVRDRHGVPRVVCPGRPDDA